MKTLGLIGGMSWESSTLYYQLINRSIQQQLGGLHSARLILYSVDFAEIEKLQHEGNWEKLAEILVDAGHSLRNAGANCLVICTNTMHKVADVVETASGLPLLHIADATGEKIRAAGLSRVGLLGTSFTMAQDFYKSRLTEKFGIEVLVPDQAGQDLVHRVIYQELCLGRVCDDSREHYQSVIADLQSRGAEAVILGCTEITLLIQQQHSPLPLFDTTEIHAEAAARFAVQGNTKHA